MSNKNGTRKEKKKTLTKIWKEKRKNKEPGKRVKACFNCSGYQENKCTANDKEMKPKDTCDAFKKKRKNLEYIK